TWLLVGPDFGMLPIASHPANQKDVIELTLRNLETWARDLNLQALKPAGADSLGSMIEIRFGGVQPETRDRVTVLPRHTRTGLPVVRGGEQVRLIVTSRLPAPVFVAVLSLDAVGAVTPVYPVRRRTREPLTPNVPVVVAF